MILELILCMQPNPTDMGGFFGFFTNLKSFWVELINSTGLGDNASLTRDLIINQRISAVLDLQREELELLMSLETNLRNDVNTILSGQKLLGQEMETMEILSNINAMRDSPVNEQRSLDYLEAIRLAFEVGGDK